MRAAPQPLRRILSLAELSSECLLTCAEYLATVRQTPRNTKQRDRLWQTFVEANAANT